MPQNATVRKNSAVPQNATMPQNATVPCTVVDGVHIVWADIEDPSEIPMDYIDPSDIFVSLRSRYLYLLS